MYVEPDQRGKGVGRAVLAGLEAAARRLGARRLVLETGTQSPDALALYRRGGFTQIDCWGGYATAPTRVCLAKMLWPPARGGFGRGGAQTSDPPFSNRPP